MGRKQMIGPVTLHVAARLTERRDELGYTTSQVIAATGLATPTVTYALQGARAISIEVLVAICDALHLDPGKLLDEAVEATTPVPPITEADALRLAADHSTTPTDRDRLEAQDHDDPA